MGTGRLEAFSDAVLAIILTIMVLEMRGPAGDASLFALRHLWPVFLSYVLSFLYIGIYWNNHHHMMHATGRVTGSVLWANLHLLFWLSLLPFTTGWMGENIFAKWPTVIYGADLLCCSLAYFIVERTIISVDGGSGQLARAIGSDLKGKLSPALYVAGIAGAWALAPWVGVAFFVATAVMWIVPNRRIERVGSTTAAPMKSKAQE